MNLKHQKLKVLKASKKLQIIRKKLQPFLCFCFYKTFKNVVLDPQKSPVVWNSVLPLCSSVSRSSVRLPLDAENLGEALQSPEEQGEGDKGLQKSTQNRSEPPDPTQRLLPPPLQISPQISIFKVKCMNKYSSFASI